MQKTFYILPLLVFFNSCFNHKLNKSNSTYETVVKDTTIFKDVQEKTFQYFWNGAEPNSGMACERIHLDGNYPENDQNTVTSGGSGFGLMAILVGVERGFITRQQALERLNKIIRFLETADRFHGAWPHWWYGNTGKVKPFSPNDNGGDLVETSYLAQGLLCVRQYFKNGSQAEKDLANKIDNLWKQIEFDWYTKNENVLYWHWSPSVFWKMNFAVHGFNECQIMYVLAASSPTHSISKIVYDSGWADAGKIIQPKNAMGFTLQMHHLGNPPNGGPLFWAHYSYLGLNPFQLKDNYANYGNECINMAKINYNWCVQNPKHFVGYSANNWGLTASYSVNGYNAHSPNTESDLGVISPTAALSSFPYTPNESYQAMINWYKNYPTKLYGKYGFFDAFSETANWFPNHYLAIDQGPAIVMMENYRTGLLWKLFMSCDEVKMGLKKLGFSNF